MYVRKERGLRGIASHAFLRSAHLLKSIDNVPPYFDASSQNADAVSVY